jgi:hypothetical protein
MANNQVTAKKSTGLVHVFSTLANPQKFVTYIPPAEVGMLPIVDKEVLIRGGAGIASKHLLTPNGVHTAITQEEYDAIKDDYIFKAHVKNGYLRIESKEYDIDRMVSDMNPRDVSAPITPEDYATEVKDGTVPLPTELEKTGTGWVAQQLNNR